jgi:ketosteroid isomerase-like protein
MSTEVPQIYRDHLAAITGPEPASVRRLWEPDGVLEFPYAASLFGAALRLEGVDAIVDYFDGPPRFADWTFRDLVAWKVEGAEEYVLEMHGSSVVVATGAAYEQDYLVRFGIGASGRLAWMREFWDPTRLG